MPEVRDSAQPDRVFRPLGLCPVLSAACHAPVPSQGDRHVSPQRQQGPSGCQGAPACRVLGSAPLRQATRLRLTIFPTAPGADTMPAGKHGGPMPWLIADRIEVDACCPATSCRCCSPQPTFRPTFGMFEWCGTTDDGIAARAQAQQSCLLTENWGSPLEWEDAR